MINGKKKVTVLENTRGTKSSRDVGGSHTMLQHQNCSDSSNINILCLIKIMLSFCSGLTLASVMSRILSYLLLPSEELVLTLLISTEI